MKHADNLFKLEKNLGMFGKLHGVVKILQTQFVHDCHSLKRERRLISLVQDI